MVFKISGEKLSRVFVLGVVTGGMRCTPMVAEWSDVSSLFALIVFFWDQYVKRVMAGI